MITNFRHLALVIFVLAASLGAGAPAISFRSGSTHELQLVFPLSDARSHEYFEATIAVIDGDTPRLTEPWIPTIVFRESFQKAAAFWNHTGPEITAIPVILSKDDVDHAGLPTAISFTVRVSSTMCYVYLHPAYWAYFDAADRQMVINHEFGHCLGNEDNPDPTSVMNPYFAPGLTSNRTVTDWDRKVYNIHWNPRVKVAFVASDGGVY